MSLAPTSALNSNLNADTQCKPLRRAVDYLNISEAKRFECSVRQRGRSSNTVSLHLPVQAEYDRLAGIYDQRWRRYIRATLDAVIDVLELRGDERVLDVASGTGELARRLLARWPGLYVVGIDLSAGMLQQARRKLSSATVRWIQGDVTALPFADAVFDVVICANSFHYFAAPTAALSQMRRVLRDGGTLIVVDWCDDYVACKLCSVWLRWTNRAFYRTYSLRACRRMTEEAGFQPKIATRFRVDWIWGLMRLVCVAQAK